MFTDKAMGIQWTWYRGEQGPARSNRAKEKQMRYQTRGWRYSPLSSTQPTRPDKPLQCLQQGRQHATRASFTLGSDPFCSRLKAPGKPAPICFGLQHRQFSQAAGIAQVGEEMVAENAGLELPIPNFMRYSTHP